MPDSPSSRSTDLRDYLRILRARKWTIIATVALVVGAAVLVSYWQTPLYRASAKLLISPAQSDESPLQDVQVPTESQLIDSEAVALLVQEKLGVDISTNELLGGLGVANIPDTLVVQLAYASDDAEEAAAVAQGFAEAYIEYRREQALNDVQAAHAAIEERIEGVNEQLEQLNADIARAGNREDDALLSTLSNSRNVLLARLGLLQERLDDLQPSQVLQLGPSADIIQSAAVPSTPISPSYPRNIGLALFLGLALGAGLAMLRERLDDRFRGRDDIEHSLGVPVLASVPRFPGPRRKGSAQLITQSEPRSLPSEAYRTLRTNVGIIAAQRGIKSFLVTSPAPVEGKSVTVGNLGIAFAQAGFRVILVSADLRRPHLDEMFGIDQDRGLSTWLEADLDSLSDLVLDPGILNLRIVPTGPIPSRPAELLASPRFDQLIAQLSESCDYLILDTPPCLVVADTSIVGAKVDASLLVIDAGSTHRSTGIRATEEIERVGGAPMGVVINSFGAEISPYYRHDSPYMVAPEGNGAAGVQKKRFRRSSAKP